MITCLYGRKVLQSFFKKLYSFSLKGLNYGIVGSGEKWTMQYVKNKLTSDRSVLFDVGANIGDYCKDLREVFGSEAVIHAFEPVPATYEKLLLNTKPLLTQTHNFGFGRSSESLEINYSEDQHTFSSIFDRAAFDQIVSEKILIDLETIDDFCSINAISTVDFIKIDTEGNDFACLEGASKMLSEKKIKFLQFEFGESSIDAGVYFKYFWNLLSPNYRIYRILKDGLDEIKTYHVRHETFYYSNFLAESK